MSAPTAATGARLAAHAAKEAAEIVLIQARIRRNDAAVSGMRVVAGGGVVGPAERAFFNELDEAVARAQAARDAAANAYLDAYEATGGAS